MIEHSPLHHTNVFHIILLPATISNLFAMNHLSRHALNPQHPVSLFHRLFHRFAGGFAQGRKQTPKISNVPSQVFGLALCEQGTGSK